MSKSGEERREAIRRYLLGEEPTSIYRNLNRSKAWFFKWLRRFKESSSQQAGDDHWYKELSRAPKSPNYSIDKATEEAIVNTRKRLEETKYAQIGAVAISWELTKLGINPPPLWTINRVLKRRGLVKKKVKGYQPKGKAYPEIEADVPNKVHQVDLLGPRYLKSKERFYSLNTLEVFRHKVKIKCIPFRNTSWVISALIKTWQKLGIPCYLQLDNQQVFFGSERRPRWFGKVIRLCLNLGIEPVFIPFREPWRNAEIEKFNDVWNKRFFRTQHFNTLADLEREEEVFEDFHNNNHCYTILGGKTPNSFEKKQGYKPKLLPSSFSYKDIGAPKKGKIHLVRFIRSDLALNIFGERFILPSSCQYEYVTATIYVKEQILRVLLFGELVKELKYKIPNR